MRKRQEETNTQKTQHSLSHKSWVIHSTGIVLVDYPPAPILSSYLSVRMSVCSTVYVSFCLPIHLYISQSVPLSIPLSCTLLFSITTHMSR